MVANLYCTGMFTGVGSNDFASSKKYYFTHPFSFVLDCGVPFVAVVHSCIDCDSRRLRRIDEW